MLNFINSLVLPLLAAALIPLLLHLLNRKKLKVIPFSSVRFLKELQNKRLRQIKLYQILIIIVRMLFIIFLVLTFARPAVRYFFTAGGGNARTTAVIILDDSYSMQTQSGMQSYFDRAKESLKTILKSFNKRDNVTVLIPLADSLRRFLISEDNPFPFARIKAGNFSPNFSASLFEAENIFTRFPNYNRELYLISDGRISEMALSDSARHVFKRLKARVYYVPIATGIPFNNVSIDTASIRSRLLELQKPVAVSVTLENHSSDDKQVTISLFDGSRRLAMQLTTIPGKNKRQVTLHFSPNHAGFFPLKLEIDDDDLLIDNTYFLSLFIPEEIPILYVQNQTPVALSEALNTLSAQTTLKIKQSNYDRWYGEPLSDYRLLVLNDPPQISQTFLTHLQQYLSSGHDVILIPGEQATQTDYNRLTRELLGQNMFQELIKAQNEGQFFALNITAVGNVLLSDLFQERPRKISWPPFYQYFKIRPQGKILLRFANGDPFLCRVPVRKNSRFWLFSAGLTLPWSRFPFSGIFVPFLHRIFSLAANSEQSNAIYLVGQPISVYLNKSMPHGNFQLAPPEGTPLDIIPRQSVRGLRFDFDGFSQPGHYKILQNKIPIQLFAVNLSAREWAKPYVDFRKLRSDVHEIPPQKLSIKSLKTARSGRELWPYFLILALLMLFLEMFLIRKLEGKPLG